MDGWAGASPSRTGKSCLRVRTTQDRAKRRAAEWLAHRLSCSGVDITEVQEGETDRLADVAASCAIATDARTIHPRSVRIRMMSAMNTR